MFFCYFVASKLSLSHGQKTNVGPTPPPNKYSPGQVLPGQTPLGQTAPIFDVGLTEKTFKSVSEVLWSFTFHWHCVVWAI